MAGGDSTLNFVNEAGDSVDGIVFGLGPKLGHWEEVMLFDVGIDALGDNFLEEFAGILEEGDWAVGLGDSVVQFLWFVDHHNCCSFPGVVSCV
jgi:hypothetical protein